MHIFFKCKKFREQNLEFMYAELGDGIGNSKDILTYILTWCPFLHPYFQ